MFYSLLEQLLVLFPLMLGAYLILSLMKLPDFSLESSYLFGAVVAFLTKTLTLPLLLLTVMGGGIAVGITVAVINQFLRLPFLLSAIITSGLFHGLVQFCLPHAGAAFSLPLPIPQIGLFLGVALTILGGFSFLLRSELGFSLAVFGNNPLFFSHHDLSTRYVVIVGLLLGHSLSALSGFFFALSNGFVDPSMNTGIVLLTLVALMLGKRVVRVKRPTFFIALTGALLYLFLSQILLRMGFNLKYFKAFEALFILTILLLDRKKKSRAIDHLGV